MEFAEPFEARSVTVNSASLVAPGAGRGAGQGGFPGFAAAMTLEVSDDGASFGKVADVGGGLGGRGGFGAMAAAGPRAEPPGGPAIDPASVLDITPFMDASGRLDWQAPAGNWTILRIGHTTTGRENHPGPDGGVGLECDKFSKEAYEFHFNHFFGKLFDVIAPLAAKGLAGAIIDTYETSQQNWTAQFPQELLKPRGYNLRQYMPAMLGRVVGSVETSERLLWDVRKTQAELMNENY